MLRPISSISGVLRLGPSGSCQINTTNGPPNELKCYIDSGLPNDRFDVSEGELLGVTFLQVPDDLFGVFAHVRDV